MSGYALKARIHNEEHTVPDIHIKTGEKEYPRLQNLLTISVMSRTALLLVLLSVGEKR
jgi:hypothetical protein